MQTLLDLERYPIDRPESARELIAHCRAELRRNGMFNLHGFVRPQAIACAVAQINQRIPAAYTHERRHNVYFLDRIEGIAADHPALTPFQTINHTLCADQLQGTLVERIYEWPPLVAFIAQVLEKRELFLMKDPLARLNVMEYRPGEALNWHFDRSIYTTTLLIQAAQAGGEFEYRSNLRADDDPNYDGVGRTLRGEDSEVRVNPLAAGTLNVFAGKNTLHRVSTVRGSRPRLVAVFSYYERPGVEFTERERLGFYGRAQALRAPADAALI